MGRSTGEGAHRAPGPRGAGAPGRPGRRFGIAVAAACLALAAPPAPAQQAPREPAAPAAPAAPGDTPGVAEVEGVLRAADTLLREARFEETLERTEELRAEIASLGDGAEARRLRARNEVMAATAHVALDQDAAARECFRRALAAEPALDLDPAATAPKVLRVFRAVRAEPRGTR